jgi:hypothetical protein
MNTIKSRIVEHVTVRAGDLVPHELNPRRHSQEQREALHALYEEIGFARSVLAYRLADGRLKLIDGHLRQSMDPDMQIEVEVLDVSDEEARKLLLSLDPLAQLADYDDRCLEELRNLTETSSNTLNALWAGLHKRDAEIVAEVQSQTAKSKESIPENYHVLVECASEQDQLTLLRRFAKAGLKCRALTS